jgi:exosortase/archaeosortase family protein
LLVFLGGLLISPNINLRARFIGFLFLPLIYLGNILRVYFSIMLSCIGVSSIRFLHETFGLIFYLTWFFLCWTLWSRVSNKWQ